MMSFEAITANHYVTSERYYKLPKTLFESPIYEDMRLDSKVSYAFLRDRLELSLKNNWVDDKGRLYLIYSNTELMKILNCSKSTLLRIKKQLAEYGLMKEVQQSNSKNGTLANKIYLGSLVTDDYFNAPVPDDPNPKPTPVSNLDQGGVKKTLGGCQNETGLVSNSATSETYYSETDNSEDISSRKAEQNSDEFSQPAEADHPSSQKQSVKYVPPKYYSLLNVIADRYNAKFTQYDLFTGEFQNYSLTYRQKMLIGQYLAEGYVTSQELIDLIENHIPVDCESPLAYFLKSLENLKRERLYEQKEIAHRNAENYYAMRQQEVVANDNL